MSGTISSTNEPGKDLNCFSCNFTITHVRCFLSEVWGGPHFRWSLEAERGTCSADIWGQSWTGELCKAGIQLVEMPPSHVGDPPRVLASTRKQGKVRKPPWWQNAGLKAASDRDCVQRPSLPTFLPWQPLDPGPLYPHLQRALPVQDPVAQLSHWR